MKMTPVKEVPKRGISNNPLQSVIEEFVKSEHEIVMIEWKDTNYKSPTVMNAVFYAAIKRSGYNIKVSLRGEAVYLSK